MLEFLANLPFMTGMRYKMEGTPKFLLIMVFIIVKETKLRYLQKHKEGGCESSNFLELPESCKFYLLAGPHMF